MFLLVAYLKVVEGKYRGLICGKIPEFIGHDYSKLWKPVFRRDSLSRSTAELGTS